MLDHFDYATYARILALLMSTQTNLCFGEMQDEAMPWPERFFLLRHDIDFCPAAALRMARLEAERGVRATYFLLYHGRHYNLLSADHADLPAALVALGHEVGLHYDATVLNTLAGTNPPFEVLRQHTDLLSRMTGKPVRSIAMHNPSTSGDDPFRGGSEHINAYDRRFTQEIAYFSDSCGAWRNEAVQAFDEGPLPPRLQLLIHPFFWGEQHRDRWERLEHYIAEKIEQVAHAATLTRTAWSQHTGVAEHDVRSDVARQMP